VRAPPSGFVAAVLLGVALITGCTTTSTGEPRPADELSATESSASAPSGTDSLPSNGAPRVDNPLDTTRFQQDPCLALTTAQLRRLDVGPAGEPVDTALGNACDWRNSETRGFAEIAFLEEIPRGLSAAYEANDNGDWAFFEERPAIEGYPAVSYGGVDNRAGGECSVLVGVSDELVFESVVRLSEGNVGRTDPCDKAAEVAGMALQTMKGDQ
jgi:hypothetical protein